MKRCTKLMFTTSIILNLALAGVIAGHVYKKYEHNEWVDINKDLAPESRDVMRAVYKEKRKEIWDMRADMQEKKEALKKTISAENFNKEDFEKAAKEMKEQNERAFDSRVSAFGQVLSKLPKPERDKLSQRTADILAGQRKWDKKPGFRGDEMEKNPFSPEAEKKEGEKENENEEKEREKD